MGIKADYALKNHEYFGNASATDWIQGLSDEGETERLTEQAKFLNSREKKPVIGKKITTPNIKPRQNIQRKPVPVRNNGGLGGDSLSKAIAESKHQRKVFQGGFGSILKEAFGW